MAPHVTGDRDGGLGLGDNIQMPGTVVTPASCASRFEAILSPIAAIASGLGPMNTMPASASAVAKLGRSDKNP